MKTKFGAIIVDGRGKIGGHVASKNRSGTYLRTKVTPVNGRTSFQQSVRNIFGSIAQAWRGLAQANRDAWNAAVPQYAKTDIFGDLRNPSGISLFQRLNNNLRQAGIAMLTYPPTPSSVFPSPQFTLAFGVESGLMLSFVGSIPSGDFLKLSATPPLSQGKSFIKNELRTLGYLPHSTASDSDILSLYTAKYGSIGSSGQKITVQLQSLNHTSGLTGVPSENFIII